VFGTQREEEKCMQGFGRETRRNEIYLEDNHRWDNDITMGLKEMGWKTWGRFFWLRYGQVMGCCADVNEPLGFIKLR
jgi:hypothetical protein